MPDDSGAGRTGGCLCGAVRYSFAGEPVFSAICHCSNCQKQSGSAFSIVTGVPATAYSQQGETRMFLDRGATGRKVERHFCPQCGSPITSRIEPLPDIVFIKAGTLDDAAAIAPTIEVFCDRALPFVGDLGETEKFARSNI